MKKLFGLVSTILALAATTFKKEDSKEGIKETAEAVVAVNEIALLCCKQFKDGVQVKDFEQFFVEFTTNPEFKAKVQAGYEKANLIPAEIKDIDAGEGMELLKVQVDYTVKYLDVFAKQA